MRAYRLFVGLATVVIVSGCSKSVAAFAVGECYAEEGLQTGEYEKLDCTDASADYEVVGIVDVGDPASDAYPGDEAISARRSECPADTEFTLVPTQETWEQADDDDLVCLAPATGGATAST